MLIDELEKLQKLTNLIEINLELTRIDLEKVYNDIRRVYDENKSRNQETVKTIEKMERV